MQLKLRRGEGAFILDGVLLPWDSTDPIVGGTINFTTRAATQRSMLNAYDPQAADRPLVVTEFSKPFTLHSADNLAHFTITLRRPYLHTDGSVVFDYTVEGNNLLDYHVRLFACRDARRSPTEFHGSTGSTIDIGFPGQPSGTSGFVPGPDPAYITEYFITANVIEVGNGEAGTPLEVGAVIGTQINGAVLYSLFNRF